MELLRSVNSLFYTIGVLDVVQNSEVNNKRYACRVDCRVDYDP